MTPDPYVASGGVASPGSWNRYAYVEGDPVNFADPAGAIPLWVGCGSIEFWKTSFDGPGSIVTLNFWCELNVLGSTALIQPMRDTRNLEPPIILEPLHPAFDEMLEASKGRLNSVSVKCAKELGGSDVSQVGQAVQATEMFDLGVLRIDDDGTISGSIAFFNGQHGQLNTNVNWRAPDYTWALNSAGTFERYHALTATSRQVGTTMTVEQFMDFYVLHEVAHKLGRFHDRSPESLKEFAQMIWKGCFQ